MCIRDRHPFHLLMHEGKLTRGQLQAWALNRYYYQSRIPIKDAAILARSEDPAFRLAWRKRILDHDGDGTKPGGIENGCASSKPPVSLASTPSAAMASFLPLVSLFRLTLTSFPLARISKPSLLR